MSEVRDVRIAYLCLQATTPGQASHAHVHEIIAGLRSQGAAVDLFEPRYAGQPAPGAVGRLIEFARLQRRLVRSLDRYDVLYVRGHALAWWASAAARRRGLPVVQECNGMVDDFFIAWPAARVVAPIVRWLTYTQFKTADDVIVGSTGLAEWLARETGRAGHVIPNGANCEVFQPWPRPDNPLLPERYAVFFGSLAPWQGIDTTLAAVTRPAWPEDVSLVVIGDGGKRQAVLDAAATSPKVVYLGQLPYDQVGEIVANAVCSLVNKEQAEFEAAGISPLKLYESMACGVPVVATERMPGLSEVVRDLDVGVLVPQHDADALATAVATIAGSPERAREMGSRARQHAEAECSWFVRAEDTAAVIANARRSGSAGGRGRGGSAGAPLP